MQGSIALAACAGIGIAMAASAGAPNVLGVGVSPVEVNGTIDRVTLGGGPITGSTIDRIQFTALDAGHYEFNVLSWEVAFDFGVPAGGPTGTATDVNGDGEIAFLDTHIRLFRHDGVLSSDDHVRGSDDEFVRNRAFADGSLYGYDSYLRVFLDPGDYVLAVGSYFLSTSSVIAGVNTFSSTYPATWDDGAQALLPSDHGDYRVTATYLPTPGSAALLAMAGLVGIGRRR